MAASYYNQHPNFPTAKGKGHATEVNTYIHSYVPIVSAVSSRFTMQLFLLVSVSQRIASFLNFHLLLTLALKTINIVPVK